MAYRSRLHAQPDWRPRQGPLVSAMVLKALEDKTHLGALIASLSTPLGEQVRTEAHDVGIALCGRPIPIVRHGAARSRRPKYATCGLRIP